MESTMNAAVNGWTWAELHAAGYTAQQAADIRGQGVTSARRWSQRNGVRWHSPLEVLKPPPIPEEKSEAKVQLQEMFGLEEHEADTLIKDPSQVMTVLKGRVTDFQDVMLAGMMAQGKLRAAGVR